VQREAEVAVIAPVEQRQPADHGVIGTAGNREIEERVALERLQCPLLLDVRRRLFGCRA
jgi:hypothetical protein